MDGLACEDGRGMLVELFTCMDLFVKLDYDMLGVPALLTSGLNDWCWMSAGVDKKRLLLLLHSRITYRLGLIGRLMSRLHRTIGAEQTSAHYVKIERHLADCWA